MKPGEAPWEYMLCGSCELSMSDCEGYVAEVSIQEDDSFPLMDRLFGGVALDFGALVRFACCCLWRASESVEHCAEVKSGTEAAREIGRYLRGERDSLPDDVSVTVDSIQLLDLGRGERGITSWSSTPQHSGGQLDQFVCFGLWFRLYTGGLPTDRPTCITRTRRVGLGQAGLFLTLLAPMVLEAIPVGGMKKFFR